MNNEDQWEELRKDIEFTKEKFLEFMGELSRKLQEVLEIFRETFQMLSVGFEEILWEWELSGLLDWLVETSSPSEIMVDCPPPGRDPE